MNGVHAKPGNPTVSRSRQLGITLVELMVALLLGLLLTAGIVQVFVGNRTTYAFNEGLSRIQENGRFALDHMAYNGRMAGYSGCLSDVAVYNNLNTPDSFRDDISNGLAGYNANGTAVGDVYAASATNPAPSSSTADWSPSLPTALVGKVLPGSDVVVLRAIDGNGQELVSPYSDSSQLFVETPGNFVEGEIMVVTDCTKASVFQLTAIQNTGFGVNLVHSNDKKFIPGNASPVWGPEQSYGLGSEIARLGTYAFYIGQGASGRPSLFQLRLQMLSVTQSGFAPEELVEGVETMQVRFGEDTDADGAINNWTSADAVGNWQEVIAVELSLLARADEEYGTETDVLVYELGGTGFNPVDDRRLRQVFSTTVGVRNRLP